MKHETSDLFRRVRTHIDAQPVVDMHSHLYAPAFGHTGDKSGREPLLLWGIDELLSYHYFVDEVFRVIEPGSITPAAFWAMPVSDRADFVWRQLFVERPPVSESCTGLVHILTSLGLDPNERTLGGYRNWFGARDINAHIDEVMRLANVRKVVMTNEPFSSLERPLWLGDQTPAPDPRFAPVLRIDPIVEQWPSACRSLASWGYDVHEDFSADTREEIRRFLQDWICRMQPDYLACSLSPDFRYVPLAETAADHARAWRTSTLFDDCLMPVARDHGLMLALMIGAKRGVNPEMKLAGDGLGRSDVSQLIALARNHPGVTMPVTMLSRENQHELCVAARKFANILPFGCWWYLNTTSQIREMTRMRLELLGTSFIPQHSDARVLEQLIYKWHVSRTILSDCLSERYEESIRFGASIDDEAIRTDASRLLDQNYTSRLTTTTL